VVKVNNYKGEKMSRNLVIRSLVAMMIFLMSGCGLLSSNRQSQQPTPSPSETPKKVEAKDLFAPKEAELTKLPAKTQLTKEPYIKGKPVTYYQGISIEKKAKGEKVFWLFQQDEAYTKTAAAQNPEEVGTVILQKCEEIPIGSYEKQFTEEKIPAYGWKCEVTIIDKTIAAVIHRKTFQSPLRKSVPIREAAKEVREPPPSVEMKDFLNSLPQK
jgi:hypothetical protein